MSNESPEEGPGTAGAPKFVFSSFAICSTRLTMFTSVYRVRLACIPCRAKKAKCSGDKPACTNCVKFRLECAWPDGRKRKRTRKEMEADFGKRPAPAVHHTVAASRSEGTETEVDARESNMAGTSHSSQPQAQETNAIQQQETARMPSFSHDAGRPPTAASLNEIGALNDPLLSQSLGMFASGQTFSPPFFPPMGNSSTGYSLHQPPLVERDGGNIGGISALNEVDQQNLSAFGGGRSGTTTPRTLWQLLANFPQQESLLPSYASGEEFAAGSASFLPQFPLLGAHQHAQQSSHLSQNQQQPQQRTFDPSVGQMLNNFLPYQTPSTELDNTGKQRQNDTSANVTQDSGNEVAKSPVAGPASATPSMGGLMKAITNQIGYLEGDETKPYLKLHYFRVVSPVFRIVQLRTESEGVCEGVLLKLVL